MTPPFGNHRQPGMLLRSSCYVVLQKARAFQFGTNFFLGGLANESLWIEMWGN